MVSECKRARQAGLGSESSGGARGLQAERGEALLGRVLARVERPVRVGKGEEAAWAGLGCWFSGFGWAGPGLVWV